MINRIDWIIPVTGKREIEGLDEAAGRQVIGNHNVTA
jgi:hypothetical protein